MLYLEHKTTDGSNAGHSSTSSATSGLPVHGERVLATDNNSPQGPAPLNAGKVHLIFFGAAAVFFFLTFGFHEGFSIIGDGFSTIGNGLVWLARHYRYVAGGLLAITVLGWYFYLLAREEANQSKSEVSTYYRKTGQVHGEARSADDWEIDEALRDKTGGFRQVFKD